MTVHFRRRRLSGMDELGAISMSVLVGLGSATVTYYLTRLLLSRERLDPGSPGNGSSLRSPETPGLPPAEAPASPSAAEAGGSPPRRSIRRSGGGTSGREG